MQVSEKHLHNQQAYEARGVIAKFEAMGHFSPSYLISVPIYKYLTLDRGADCEAQPVQFLGAAPVIEDKGESILDLAKLSKATLLFTQAWFIANVRGLMNYLQHI